jgi:hypothetical protein
MIKLIYRSGPASAQKPGAVTRPEVTVIHIHYDNAAYIALAMGGLAYISSAFCSLIGLSARRRITQNNRNNDELFIINLATAPADVILLS